MIAKRTVLAGLILIAIGAVSRAQVAPPHTQLVIVVDGLRPDYVTPDVMPRLSQLG